MPGSLAKSLTLLRVRETSRINVYPCPDCGKLYEISQLLTGFTAPTEALAVEIKQVHDQVTDIATGVNGPRGHLWNSQASRPRSAVCIRS